MKRGFFNDGRPGGKVSLKQRAKKRHPTKWGVNGIAFAFRVCIRHGRRLLYDLYIRSASNNSDGNNSDDDDARVLHHAVRKNGNAKRDGRHFPNSTRFLFAVVSDAAFFFVSFQAECPLIAID